MLSEYSDDWQEHCCLILNKVDTKSSRIMVKKPNESSYVKSSNRINEMRLIYEMRHLQHLSVPEIMSKTIAVR